MPLFPLRPLQEKAILGLRESLRSGKRHPIIQAPTGFGKTIVAAHIVTGAIAKRNRVAFVVPALSLIDQTFDRFVSNGIDPGDMGVFQGDHPHHHPNAPIQICSVQTIVKRGAPDVTFVVIDECHISFKAMNEWIDREPKKVFVGLSASPWSRGLADRFDDLIIPTSIDELTSQGFLAPVRAFAPTKPDLSGLPDGIDGDYKKGPLSERMSKHTIIADVVETWLDKAEGRPTLAFAVDRGHADLLQRQFQQMGVPAAYIDANTERAERGQMGRALENGQLKVICCIDTMSTGVDLDIRCISYAASTKSEIKWVQRIGRGLRTANGKDYLLLFDHSSTALTLGLPSEIVHTELTSSKGKRKENGDRPQAEAARPLECRQCGQIVPFKLRACPGCGQPIRRACKVVVEEGDLVEFGGARKADAVMFTKRDLLAQLKWFAEEHSYKPGWASNKFREKVGDWPPREIKECAPAICSNKVRSWIRSSQIRWTKGRDKRSDDQVITDSIDHFYSDVQ